MIKTLLFLVCATFTLAVTVSADIPTPPCNPNCVVSISSH